MRKYLYMILLMSSMSGMAAAAEADVAQGEQVRDPNRVICTNERTTGSNIPHRVCMTAAERDAIREQSQREMGTIGRKTPAIGGQ